MTDHLIQSTEIRGDHIVTTKRDPHTLRLSPSFLYIYSPTSGILPSPASKRPRLCIFLPCETQKITFINTTAPLNTPTTGLDNPLFSTTCLLPCFFAPQQLRQHKDPRQIPTAALLSTTVAMVKAVRDIHYTMIIRRRSIRTLLVKSFRIVASLVERNEQHFSD